MKVGSDIMDQSGSVDGVGNRRGGKEWLNLT